MNEYGEASSDSSRFHYRLATLLMLIAALGLLLAAVRRFLPMVVRLDGLLAAALMLLVGTAVGRVVATQAVPRVILIVVCAIFYAGLVNGWIRVLGDELTMWAFLCMSMGLLLGAAWRSKPLWQSGV